MEGAKPAAAMVALQLLFAALQICIKLALNDSMDVRVLVACRFMFAAAVLCPIAFFVERYISSAHALLEFLCLFPSLCVGEFSCKPAT